MRHFCLGFCLQKLNFMTFGSVMNNELRIEMIISYFLFYSTETGSAVIKCSGILQAVLTYRNEAINCFCVF